MRKEGLVVFVCAVAVVFVAVLTPCAGQRGGGGGGWSWWENWNHGNGGDDDHTGRWNQQQASSTTTTTTTNQVVDPLSGPSQMSTVNIVHDATWSNDAILGQTESTLVVAGNPPQHALVQVDLDALGQLLGEQLNSAATLTSVELSLYFIGVTVTPFTGSLPPLIVQAVAGPLDLACTGDCTVPSASLTAQLQSPTQVAFPSTAGHLSWDITSIVEAWHTNTTATKAWTGVLLVRLGDATATSLEVKFASTEHQDAAKHPLVTIHRAIIDPPHPMTSTATTTTTTTTAATGAGGTTSVTATTTAGTTAGATVDASASVVNNNNNNNDDDDDDDDTRSAAQQGSTRAPGDGSSGNSNSNSSGSVAGIAAGVAAACVLVIAAALFVRRRGCSSASHRLLNNDDFDAYGMYVANPLHKSNNGSFVGDGSAGEGSVAFDYGAPLLPTAPQQRNKPVYENDLHRPHARDCHHTGDAAVGYGDVEEPYQIPHYAAWYGRAQPQHQQPQHQHQQHQQSQSHGHTDADGYLIPVRACEVSDYAALSGDHVRYHTTGYCEVPAKGDAPDYTYASHHTSHGGGIDDDEQYGVVAPRSHLDGGDDGGGGGGDDGGDGGDGDDGYIDGSDLQEDEPVEIYGTLQ